MLKIKMLITGTLIFLFNSCDVNNVSPVSELSGIEMIKLSAEEEDLERLFNNRFTDLAIPVKVQFKGEMHTGVLRAAGAGSRYFPKFSFRVILDDSRIYGIRDFSLSAQPSDITYIKTALASYLYRETGFQVFFSEPVFVTLNNKNYGIYNFIERINEDFLERRNLKISELYKVQFDAKFSFLKVNNLRENFDKEMPDDNNYTSLAELIEASDQVLPEEIPEIMSKYMDIENYLWYHAISTIRSDPDSYTNNFYFYKLTFDSPFKFFPWDFDKTFTADIGLYGYNELIESLLRNELVYNSYTDKLRYLLYNIFTEYNLFPIIDSYYSRLKDYYQYDPYLRLKDMKSEIDYLKSYIIKRRTDLINLLNYAEN